jgi:hypothetical protein
MKIPRKVAQWTPHSGVRIAQRSTAVDSEFAETASARLCIKSLISHDIAHGNAAIQSLSIFRL